MQRHTLYAYVDGSDLEDVAALIEEKLVEFAEAPGRVTRLKVVNQKADLSGSYPDDLPDWDLGINLELPNPGDEPDGWFGDVERVAGYLAKLHSAFDREFVIGIADNVTGVTEDLFFVESSAGPWQAAERHRRSRRLASAPCGHNQPLADPTELAQMLHALFICSRNRLRSPTAAHVFSAVDGVETESAGLAADAECPISLEQVAWADIIFVMEKVHRGKLSQRFGMHLNGKKVVCLDIPDNFELMQPELVALLERRVSPHLRVRGR